MNNNKKNNRGFSLIELLVVIGIIAILTGLIAFNFNAARMRARDVQRKSDLKELRSALELYKNDNGGEYPSGTYTEVIATLSDADYIPSRVQDPKVSLTGDATSWTDYSYTVGANNVSYTISMCFENRADIVLADATANCGQSNAGRLYVFNSQ